MGQLIPYNLDMIIRSVTILNTACAIITYLIIIFILNNSSSLYYQLFKYKRNDFNYSLPILMIIKK